MKSLLYIFFILVSSKIFSQTTTDTLENENWKNHFVYKNNDKQIVIFSFGRHRIKNYSRKIFIDIVKSDPCTLRINKVRYFDRSGKFPVLTFPYSQHYDLIRVLSILSNLRGVGKYDDQHVSNDQQEIQVDCEMLDDYIANLPDTLHGNLNSDATKWRRWSFMPNAVFGSAWNSITVDTSMFNNTDALTTREQGERKTKAGVRSVGFIAAYHITEKQMIYSEYANVNMGFQSRYHAIDWTSGLPHDSSVIVNYNFKNTVVGLGWMYSSASDEKNINLIMLAGLYYSFKSKLEINGKDEKGYFDNNSMEKNRLSAKVGMGVSFPRKDSWWTVNIMPVYQWELTKLNEGKLSTHLHIWGINAGLSINLKSENE